MGPTPSLPRRLRAGADNTVLRTKARAAWVQPAHTGVRQGQGELGRPQGPRTPLCSTLSLRESLRVSWSRARRNLSEHRDGEAIVHQGDPCVPAGGATRAARVNACRGATVNLDCGNAGPRGGRRGV